jgi:hypothetical protein
VRSRRDAHAGSQPASFDEVRSWATSEADQWYLSDNADRLTFDDLAPGRALRIEVFNLLFAIGLRQAGLTSDLEAVGPGPWLKTRGFDRMVRAWLLRGQSLYVRPRRADRPKVMVVSEMATPSALLASAAILRTFEPGSTTALAADPRARRFWAAQGLPTTALVATLADERRVLLRSGRQIRGAITRLLKDPPQFMFGEADITKAVLPRLGRVLARSVPWLHVERLAIRRSLESTRPGVVLLASDQHRIGALVTIEARKLQIPTAVIQHGLPQHDVGYVPVTADRVLTWSDESSRWFIARGTRADRLIVVGNPAFDALAGSGPGTEASHQPGNPLHILLALTPSTREINETVLTVALDAVALVPDSFLTVKLHPGDGNWSHVRQLVGHHSSVARTRIAHREPLTPLLKRAGVIWLHRSSVAVEALAAQVPVVVIASSAPSTADLELKGLELPVATGPADLARLTSELKRPDARRSFFAVRPVEAFIGPPPGQASNRAHEALAALATIGGTGAE